MAKIIFEGWEVGMRKIPFIKLLNQKGGISLTESKQIKDRVVNGEIIVLTIDNEERAKELVGNARKLGVKARMEPDQ